MKLIIREYLASLKERDELDAMLPDLLSQIGFEVFSKPSTGGRQYGVDVAAYGSLGEEAEKVYLFTVKAGDINRSIWNTASPQSLKPSLDEILDDYIPTHLPSEYANKPIEICICFGGDIKENVRFNLTNYEEKHKTERISFSEWGGERLAAYVEKYLLREELLPDKCRSLLRKSLAMLDEADVSYKYFRQLIHQLSSQEFNKPQQILTSIRQQYICLWILYGWCREADNLESSFLAGEVTLLNAWFLAKNHFEKKNKTSRAIVDTLASTQMLNLIIASHFLEEKVLPHTGKLYALSSAVNPSCSVDVNIKLFDLLGRIAITGIWGHWVVTRLSLITNNESNITKSTEQVYRYQAAIKQLITNNPILFAPCKDEQAIDITIAGWFLALHEHNHSDLKTWLNQVVQTISFLFGTNGNYPCTINAYHELIEHPKPESDSYREEVTKGSILYPYISTFAAIFKFDEVFSGVKELQTKYLPHCNFQVWFPDKTSEDHFYLNDAMHGATLSNVNLDNDKITFLKELFEECELSSSFDELSAVKYGHWPMILLACRHYRMPVPMHFLKGLIANPLEPNKDVE